MDAANKCTPEKWAKRKRDGRGHHVAVSMGLSYGGGSKVRLLSGRFHDPYCLSSTQANSR